MSKFTKHLIRYFILVLGIIALDQWSKIYVHYHMDIGPLGEIKILGNWFKLHYTLNPGMAFGIEFGSAYGKLLLTAFRFVFIVFLIHYFYILVKKKGHILLLCGLASVLGGAMGNLIDSIFYGVWFNNAPYNAPMRWFYGQVIDMIYVDIWEGYFPTWMPFWRGEYVALWPIFNIADSAICIGVFFVLLGQHMGKKRETKKIVALEEK